MTRSFDEIRQLGFVVPDLDAALEHWTGQLGVGPFFKADVVQADDFVHRGTPSGARIAAALGNSGPMQIELIQPLDDEPSLWREFLDEGREGLQHVAYWTDDFERVHTEALTAGYREAHGGVLNGGRFVYFESDTPGGYAVELSEQSPAKRAFFGGIREAAVGWDGSDPVRMLGDLSVSSDLSLSATS